MKLVNLTSTILGLNAALDTGKYDGITIDEVEKHIERGDLFSFIEETLGDDIDLSLQNTDIRREINDGLAKILGGYAGREGRKWGIENRGMCLLIAWLNELIQQNFNPK